MATATASIFKKQTYTVDEYFELEKYADIRHEFVYGKLIPMQGESITANRIAGNCDFRLQLALRSKGYVIIRHDVRTIIKAGKLYRYPDVQVAKLSEISETHAVTRPKILIEVTSINSAKTDNDDKVNEYTALESLDYYLIISQEEMLVKVFRRTSRRSWQFDVYEDRNEVINLPEFGFHLSLADIYENVIFAEARSDND